MNARPTLPARQRLAAMALGFLAVASLPACAQVARTIDANTPPAHEAPAHEAPAPLPAPLTVAPYTPPAPKPPCEGDRVAVVADYPTDCDVQPPQALDVWWPGSDGIEQAHFQVECDHMGGTLEWADDQFVCRGVDY